MHNPAASSHGAAYFPISRVKGALRRASPALDPRSLATSGPHHYPLEIQKRPIIWPDDFRSRGRLQPQDFSFSPVYRYLEFPRWDAVPNDPRPYTRAIRNPRLDVEMQRRPGDRDGARPEWINYDPVFEAVAQPQARYGVTWRGFEPSPGDRERGIYGNEYLIVDLSKNEVMAYARDFAFSGRPSAKYWASRGGWVDNAMPCRGGPVMPSFLNRVLKPQSTFKVGASKP